MHTYARDTWLGLTIWTRNDTELRVVAVVAYKCTLALSTILEVMSCVVLTKQTPPYIAPSDNPADMMTKCVPKDAFFRHRAVLLGSVSPPEPAQEAPSGE